MFCQHCGAELDFVQDDGGGCGGNGDQYGCPGCARMFQKNWWRDHFHGRRTSGADSMGSLPAVEEGAVVFYIPHNLFYSLSIYPSVISTTLRRIVCPPTTRTRLDAMP